MLRAPIKVTKAERDAHEITHTPYRSWCRHCVRARGRNTPHRRRDGQEEESGAPRISMDYFFMSTRDEEASKNPILVLLDESTGETFARAVGQKGLGRDGDMDWLVKDIAEELRAWGHAGGEGGHIILKSDSEPAIAALRNAIAKYHGGKVVQEHPPRGESQSNGAVENAGKTVREYARVLREQIEYHTKVGMESAGNLTVWMIRWAAMLSSRYAVGKDGLTAYERRRGRKCRLPVVIFGEKVWYKELRAHKERRDKIQSEWREGLWLGHSRCSNEHIIGTREGTVRAYAIKRQDEAERWSAEWVQGIQGTPQQPDPTKPGVAIPVKVHFDPPNLESADVPLAAEQPRRQIRRMKLTGAMLEKYGYTEGCEGCRYKRAGLGEARPHTEECRARISTAMDADEDGRRHKAQEKERLDRRIAERLEQEVGLEEGAAPDPSGPNTCVTGRADDIPSGPWIPSGSADTGGRETRAEPSQPGNGSVHPGEGGEPCPTGPPEGEGHGRESTPPRDPDGGRRGHSDSEDGGRSRVGDGPEDGGRGRKDRSRSPRAGRAETERGLRGEEVPVPDSPVPGVDDRVKRDGTPRETAASKRPRMDDPDVMTDKSDDDIRGLVESASSIMDVSNGWNFTKSQHRELALRVVEVARPTLIVGMSTFGQPHGRHGAEVQRENSRHIDFVLQLYRIQQSAGRWYAHRHPASGTRHNLAKMMRETRAAGEHYVKGIQRSEGDTVITNSREIGDNLRWTEGSCPVEAAIQQGLGEQARLDKAGLWRIAEITADTPVEANIPQEPDEEQGTWASAWDDVSGHDLNPAEVVKARAKEMAYIHEKGVWTVIPREVARQRGWPIVKTRWIDINKGDDDSPVYRSRLVAKEFRAGAQEGVFAATPPLEAVRLLLSDAATLPDHDQQSDKVVMINDVARAFFEAPVRRMVCVELPPEAAGETEGDVVGHLQMSLYGTRDAAANFQAEVRKFMLGLGYEQSQYSASVFWHRSRQLKTLVHGDDFMTTGSRDNTAWFRRQLEHRFEIKTSVIGGGRSELSEGRLLGRIIRCTPVGWEYEADQRHADLIIRGLHLEGAKGVKSPGEDEKAWQRGENGETLPRDEWTSYRALAARANYLAQDRADLQFAAKKICRGMASPIRGNLRAMKRLGRYLIFAPRVVWTFGYQQNVGVLRAFSDSDWAGCATTGRSTSGGAIMRGHHCLRTWSSTQKFVTLSSAEAELMALLRAATESVGLVQLAASWGLSCRACVHVDSSAALAVTSRKGNGRLRHVRIADLWIQEAVERGLVECQKVQGLENPADAMTKHLAPSRLQEMTRMLAQNSMDGDADSRLHLRQLNGGPVRQGLHSQALAEGECKPPTCMHDIEHGAVAFSLLAAREPGA